jgi:hypothetical protein
VFALGPNTINLLVAIIVAVSLKAREFAIAQGSLNKGESSIQLTSLYYLV